MKSVKRYIQGIIAGQAFFNFFNLALNQGVNVITALIITPLLYQSLGEKSFGLVNLALSLVMLFAIFVGLGYNLNAPKHIALIKDSKKECSEYISGIIISRLFIALLVSLIVLFLVYGLNFFPNYSSILVLSLIYLFGEALMPVVILQGFDRLFLLALGNAFIKAGYLIGVLVLVTQPTDAIWVNFIFGGATLIVNLMTLIYIYSRWSFSFVPIGIASFFKHLKENFHFLLATLASYVLVNGGYIILSNFIPDKQLGQYALAQRIALLLRMVPVFLSQAILQNASRLYKSDKSEFKKYLARSYKNGLAITIFIALLFQFISEWVVVILSGEQVDYSTDILRILSFLPFLGMLNVPNIIKILVSDHKEVMSESLWASTFVMLILSLLGSYFYGGYGLAVALLFSELVTYIIHFVNLKKSVSEEFQ